MPIIGAEHPSPGERGGPPPQVRPQPSNPAAPQPTPPQPTRQPQPVRTQPNLTAAIPPRAFGPRVSHEVDSDQPSGSRVFVGAPDYRVFIWGMEVSTDVFSVSTTLTLNENVSTAMVNIVNDNEKWTVPPMWATYNLDVIPDELSDADLSQAGGFAIPTNTKSQAAKQQQFDIHKFAKKKHEYMLRKLKRDTPLSDSAIQKLVAIMKNSSIYPMLPGSPVFQMADPIRIFIKNPWNFGTPRNQATTGLSGSDVTALAGAGITLEGENGELISPDQIGHAANDAEEWYFAFTGYIATVTEDFDAQSNRSIIRLQCEDIRRLLRYMRTSTNPNVFDLNVYDDGKTVRVGKEDEFNDKMKTGGATASDIVLVTGSADIKANMKIVRTNPEDQGLMELLLFGDLSQIKDAAGSPISPLKGKQLLAAGVLGFSQEGEQLFLLPVDNNYEGQLTTPRTGGLSILDEMYPILTEDEVTDFGQDWSLGQDPKAAPSTIRSLPARSNRLFVILPDHAHFPELKYPPDWEMRVDFYSEFRSRLDVINEFVQNADLIWYATPKGDIVVEFPSYDALPQLHQPPWNSVFTLQNEFSRFAYTEDDHEIKTFTILAASASDGVNTSNIAPFLLARTKPNPELIARYGVREQRSNRPFFYDEKTLPDAVEGLAAMLQELANSTAYRIDGLEMLPNFRAVPGRAYLFKFRNMIGFCDQVSHQIVWGGLCQTVYHFKYIRHYDPQAGDWVKISGQFGWSWKRSSDTGVDVAGAQHVTIKAVDDSAADPLGDMLQSRINDWVKNGTLTLAEIERAQELKDKILKSPPNSDDRATAMADFNALAGNAASLDRLTLGSGV